MEWKLHPSPLDHYEDGEKWRTGAAVDLGLPAQAHWSAGEIVGIIESIVLSLPSSL